MRIFPIQDIPLNQKRNNRISNVAFQKKATSYSYATNNIKPSFKSTKITIKQYAFAIEKLAQMGIKGENIFFNKDILKKLPNDPQKFEECFYKLEKAHQILKDFDKLDYNIAQQFLHSKNPNFDKFYEIASAIKKQGVFEDVVGKIFNFIYKGNPKDHDWNDGFEKTAELLKLREAVIKNKDDLKQINRSTSGVEIDIMLFNYPEATSNALEILGIKGFVYSLKDKIDNVNTYIATLGLTPWVENVKKELIELTNPTASERYIKLNKKVKDLKKMYNPNLPANELKILQNEINTATNEARLLIKNSIKDPKDIFERSLMVCELQGNGSKHALDLIKVLNPKNKDEEKILNDTIISKLIIAYNLSKIPNIETTIKSLNLHKSKYIANFFKARNGFRNDFKELIKLITRNPNKTPFELFESLDANKKTKIIFEQLSLNYERYANHDSNIEVGNIKNLYGDSTNIRVRPVNMNDILKVLTLGNEACCCTKLGGSKEQSSIPYLKYKMFSALEILDGNTPIGNTMCYFALVNNKLSFVLDNIEIKREYAFQDTIRDAVIKCARKFTNEVSNVRDLPIYICTQHNKVGDADLPLNFFDLKPLGCFEKDETYFDFLNNTVKYENFRTYKDIMLYDVTFIADERDKPKDMIIDSINKKWQLYITPNNNENINNNR